MALFIWLLSLSLMSSRFIHVVESQYLPPFHDEYFSVWMGHAVFIHSSSAMVNMCVQVFVCLCLHCPSVGLYLGVGWLSCYGDCLIGDKDLQEEAAFGPLEEGTRVAWVLWAGVPGGVVR